MNPKTHRVSRRLAFDDTLARRSLRSVRVNTDHWIEVADTDLDQIVGGSGLTAADGPAAGPRVRVFSGVDGGSLTGFG